jgi:hypothetical protein
VVRFGIRDDWEAIVSRYPSVFGPLRKVAPPAPVSGFEERLFSAEWVPLLRQVASDGIAIEPGRDVTSNGRVVGRTVAEVRGGNGTIDVIDVRAAGADDVSTASRAEGRSALAIDPTDPAAAQRIRSALGGVE